MDRFDQLLEPGSLLKGALAQDLLQQHFQIEELNHGQLLGPFQIERELGRGGMGIVYLATRADGAYQQRVAIKWLPIGKHGSKHVAQFRRERQILAQLNHPNIAKLLDGGRSDHGHLWFALEYIDGLPVDKHAVKYQLSWQARIRLLLPVIAAVQFSHSQLLVHRDIKPDNILIDFEGTPKLIDFGVASMLVDAACFSACTPGFASPEQMNAEPVTTASDIWQLGHLLQCVLEAHPINQAALHYPNDLHAIIEKAKQRQPNQRYTSAAELHADLLNLLQHRPVQARPAGVLHRAALLTRAHPTGTIAAALSFSAFIAITLGFMLRLAAERDAAKQAQFTSEQINAFLLQDFLPAADPLQDGSSEISVADLGEQALTRVESRLGKFPEVAGNIESNLGDMLGNLGRFRSARAAYTNAIAHLTQAAGSQDERVLRARLNLEKTRIEPSMLQTADTRLLPLRTDILKALGPHSALLIETDAYLARAAFLRDDFKLCQSRYLELLPRERDASPEELGGIYIGLSLCESRLGNWDQAILHARHARTINTQALGPNNPLTLETQIAIETALLGSGRYEESAQVSRELVAALEGRYGRMHPTTLTILHDQGLATLCAGKPKEGVKLLKYVVEGRAKTLGTQHPWYAMTQSVLAMALIKDHQLDDAAQALSMAREALGNHGEELPYISLTLLQNEADLALAQHRYADAITRYRETMQIASRMFPSNHRGYATLQIGVGLALINNGQKDEGQQSIKQALNTLGTRADCRSEMIASARQALSKSM